MAGELAVTAQPNLLLVRHGETDWSLTGQHTGRTDLPLTTRGRQQALPRRPPPGRTALLDGALESPPAGPRDAAGWPASVRRSSPTRPSSEWDYGEYEGRTTAEIRAEVPGWSLWRDGVPGGEAIEEVAARVDALLSRLRLVDGDVLVISHGHLLRVLAARWIRLPATAGRHLELAPASVSTLGWEREEPVVTLWNSTAGEA